MKIKLKHIHIYKKGKSKSVIICFCGDFKFTKWAIKNLPTFTEVKQS